MRKLFSIFAAMLVALVANAAVIRINTETEDALRLALNDAKSGDIIEMAAGRYVESNANFIAFTGKEVTVRAALGAEVILQPKVPIIIAEGGKAELIGIQIDASHLNDVEDWYEHVIYASDADANNRLVMKDCVLKNFLPNKSAIFCSASNKLASIEIDGCYIHDIMKSVIFIESTDSTNLTVTNSTIANVITNTESYWAGIIDSRATKGDVLVDHCTFYNAIPMNTDYGAIGKIKTAGKTLVSNSIFMLPEAKDGIRCIRDAKEAKNCLVFNYIKDSNWGIHSSVTKTDCINDKDPLFKDAANSDFTLLEGSPALTAGPDSSCIGDPFWGPKAAPEYYIVGTMNDWYYDEDYKLAANPAAEGEFMLKTTLAIGDEFKVVDSDENWYPAGLDNNFVVDKSFAGEKTVYFRPDGKGGEGWHEGTIFVEKTIFSSCADVYKKAKNDAVNLEDVVVTYVNGKNVYVKDETGAMLLFLPAAGTWEAGDTLSNVCGVVDIYYGLHEVKPSADQVAAVTVIDGVVPAPEKLTSIDTLDISKYVLLENVTVQADTFKTSKATNLNMVLGKDTIVLRNNFKLAYVFEAGKEYNIIGTVSIYNGTLQVFFISAEEVAHTYTVAGNSDAAFGTAWDPKNEANDMLALLDGTFAWLKQDLTLSKGEIEFKVVEDHAWTHAWPAQNYKLAIPEDGIYTVEIIFNPAAADSAKVSAKAEKTGEAVVIPTVAMHGNFTGSWKDTELFTLNDDSLSATLTLELAAGTYEFGMRIGGAGNWTANGANLTRENSTTVLTEGSGNMHITADVAGEYIFSYIFDGEILMVMYPDKPEPMDSIPATAPAAPTAAEDDVLAIYCNHYTNNNLNFAISGWAGAYETLVIDNTNIGFWTDMTWECIIDPAHTDDPHDLSGYKKLHVDIWAPKAAKVKFTVEAVAGGNYKDGNKVDLVKGWNAFDFVVAEWPGNYDFKNVKCFVWEQYQTPAEESFEHNPFAFANIYFYEKDAQAIDNTLAGEKAVKTIVNGQLLIIKNGKTFNVLGTVVR